MPAWLRIYCLLCVLCSLACGFDFNYSQPRAHYDYFPTADSEIHVPTSKLASGVIIANVMIGTPARPYRFRLNPSVGTLRLSVSYETINDILQQRVNVESPSYFSGRDIVSFGDVTFYHDIQYVARGTFNDDECDGEWGIGKTSPIWRFFSSATIAIGSIVLGRANSIIQHMRHAPVPILRCLPVQRDSLCVFTGSIGGQQYAVELFSIGDHIAVPDEVYSRYVDDQVLYGVGIHALESIVLSVSGEESMYTDTQSECLQRYHGAGFSDVVTCGAAYNFEITPDMYIQTLHANAKRVILAISGESVAINASVSLPLIRLPINMLTQVMVHVMHTVNGTHVILKHYTVYTSQPVDALLLGFLLTLLYILYTIVSMTYSVAHADLLFSNKNSEQLAQAENYAAISAIAVSNVIPRHPVSVAADVPSGAGVLGVAHSLLRLRPRERYAPSGVMTQSLMFDGADGHHAHVHQHSVEQTDFEADTAEPEEAGRGFSLLKMDTVLTEHMPKTTVRQRSNAVRANARMHATAQPSQSAQPVLRTAASDADVRERLISSALVELDALDKKMRLAPRMVLHGSTADDENTERAVRLSASSSQIKAALENIVYHQHQQRRQKEAYEMAEIGTGAAFADVGNALRPSVPAPERTRVPVVVHVRTQQSLRLMTALELAGLALAVYVLFPSVMLRSVLHEQRTLSWYLFELTMVLAIAAGVSIAFTVGAPVFALSGSTRVVLVSLRRFSVELVILAGIWTSFIFLRTSEIGSAVFVAISLRALFVSARTCAFTLVVLARFASTRQWRLSPLAILVVALELFSVVVLSLFTYHYNMVPFFRSLLVLFTALHETVALTVFLFVLGFALLSALSQHSIEKMFVHGRGKFIRLLV